MDLANLDAGEELDLVALDRVLVIRSISPRIDRVEHVFELERHVRVHRGVVERFRELDVHAVAEESR